MNKFFSASMCLLALAVVVRVVVLFSAPAEFRCDDESAHYNYARYIYEEGRLPDFMVPWFVTAADTSLQDSLFFYESYQQPGFYSIASLLVPYGPIGTRVLSTLLFLIGFFLLYQISSDWRVGVLLLFPGVVFVSTMTTNESLLFLGASVTALALVRGSLLTYVCGLVLMSIAKVTGVGVAAFLGLYFLFVEDRLDWAVASACVLASFLPVTLNRFALADTQLGSFAWKNVVTFVPQSVFSLVWKPGLLVSSTSLLVGGVLAVILGTVVWSRYLRGSRLSPHMAASIAIVLVWVYFSITHVYGEGRLLLAAVPFLVAHRGCYEPA